MKEKALSVLSLFSSTSTLICCAIPTLLVALGLGASLAGFISYFPQIVWLSEQKDILFTSSFVLISLAWFLHFKSKSLDCPIDKVDACKTTKGFNFWILLFSSILLISSFIFVYLLPIFLFT